MTHHGIYRGVVMDTEDPEDRGRLAVQVPNVAAQKILKWAWPCLPVGATSSDNLPAVGAGVWIMFEGGDPEYPVWIGTWPLEVTP